MATQISDPSMDLAGAARATAQPEAPRAAAGTWLTILLCGATMIVEGFDTYAISFAGQPIAREWHLTQGTVGQIYAVGIAASLLGSILFGMLADRFGRKQLLILATVLFGIATCLGAMAPSVGLLVLSRIVAGAGLGASVPCAMALATDVAPARFRASVPMLLSAAIGGGIIVASLAAASLMPHYGWRGLFWLGGTLPLAVATLMPRFLRESPALAHGSAQAPWRALLEPQIARLAIVVTLALFFTYIVTFFFGFWLPTLVGRVAPDIRTVGLSMTIIKSCSLIGSLVLALVVTRFGMAKALPVTFTLAALVVFVLFGQRDDLPGVVIMLSIASFFVDGAFSGIIGFGAAVFPSRVRATAIGLTVGFARLTGGTIGPMMAGVLLDHHLSLHAMGMVYALPLLAAGMLVAVAARVAARQAAA